MCRSGGTGLITAASVANTQVFDHQIKRVVIGGRNDTQVVPYDMDDKSLQFVELLTEVDKH